MKIKKAKLHGHKIYLTLIITLLSVFELRVVFFKVCFMVYLDLTVNCFTSFFILTCPVFNTIISEKKNQQIIPLKL